MYSDRLVIITRHIHFPSNHTMWNWDSYVTFLSYYILSVQLFDWLFFFLLLLFVCFWVTVFEYQIRPKFPRRWNCLWQWIGKRIFIPLPIQRISWFMLWWVVEGLYTIIQKLIIYFNDWCTVILSDKLRFISIQLQPICRTLPFVRDCARCFHAYCLGAGFRIYCITAYLLFRKGTNAGKIKVSLSKQSCSLEEK